MDIGSLFLILALIVLVVAYVSLPFRQRKSVFIGEAEHNLSALLAERDRILSALMELDFDYDLQKIPEEIYPLQRNNLMERGGDILRQLDEFYDGSSEEASDRLEATVASRRADAKKAAVDMDDPLEAMIAARKAGSNKGTAFCPNCGEKALAKDRFCTSCGNNLA